MKARVDIYSNDGKTYIGTLPTIGLSFSEEVGGAGTCTFEALKADLDDLRAWDSVIKIGLETAPDVWMIGPCYVIRRAYSHKVGALRYSFTCRTVLEAWASEAVLLPEYVVGTVPRTAGTERGLGWMSTAYTPEATWTKNYVSTRNTYPPKWPTASGAQWISASSVTGQQAKFFRSTMTVPAGAAKTVQFWLSADESSTLWVAGEKMIETSSSETGFETFKTVKKTMYPGTYAVGIYSVSDSTAVSGGLPDDPVIMAAAIIGTGGVVSSWIAHTDDTWKAIRRAEDPPNDIPPGPTPGAMMQYLIKEIGVGPTGRAVSGWPGVSMSFNATTDSYGKSWGVLDIVERQYQYATTTYWSIFQALAESDECDIWMENLTLHCAPRQGQARNLVLTEAHMNTHSTTGTEGSGTWVLARAYSGWVAASLPEQPRREYAIEVGQSITTAVATKVADASLRDAWRSDASGSLNPPQTGYIPYVDYKIGDIVTIAYLENDPYGFITVKMSITSLSATTGEGGLLWDVEFTEQQSGIVPF